MSEEIKDILEHLLATQKINNGWTSFSDKECKLLYDYITNLQQKENIIKEVREYIEKELKSGRSKDNQWLMGCYDEDKHILEILDKENI